MIGHSIFGPKRPQWGEIREFSRGTGNSAKERPWRNLGARSRGVYASARLKLRKACGRRRMSWISSRGRWPGCAGLARAFTASVSPPKRSAHRRQRPRRALPGMMPQQDASRFARLPGQVGQYDLVVTLDDATSAIYSAFPVAEEGEAANRWQKRFRRASRASRKSAGSATTTPSNGVGCLCKSRRPHCEPIASPFRARARARVSRRAAGDLPWSTPLGRMRIRWITA